MTSKNLSTGIEYGPRRYTVGKTGSWTLTVFQDGVIECSCPDATIRRRACKHIEAFQRGEITSKPRVRVTHRPPIRRARTSAEMRDFVSTLDV